VTRKLYPNVDFYNGLIYRAMGFPTDMYPVLFALPLLAGWLAHWNEALSDSKSILQEPKQYYSGRGTRNFIEMSERKENKFDTTMITSQINTRR